MTATITETRQQATELRDFLLTTVASNLHPDAPVMASWLTILLTTLSPDAEELIAGEVESIIRIMQ